MAGFTGGAFPQLPMNLVLVKGLTVTAHTTPWPGNPEADAKKHKETK